MRALLLRRSESGKKNLGQKLAPALAVIVLLLLALVPFATRAEDDLPGRVGRVAEFAGQLYLSSQERPAEWSAIGINYPITSGDNLWVSSDGRAELDYGGGQFRLAGDTNLQVSRLDDRQLTLFVARGEVIVRVRVLDTGDAAVVDTPGTQVTLTRPGLYRIEVAADGQGTTLSVREGEALVGLATGAQQLFPGQTASVIGMDAVAAELRNASPLDGFDAWSTARDHRYERGRSTAYVSKQMVGYAELDDHGNWDSNVTYGPVWYPNAVPVDWAPYSDGYWTSTGGWGLTWVDAAPWGYAPTHYGRWVRVGGRWAWCPGAFVGRPRWAPALVGWYGGAGWGITAVGGAAVYGWVPLGWGDPFEPWWNGCSARCWARYNEPFAVNGTARTRATPSRYSNMGVPGAMTTVAGVTLVTRKPVAANKVPVPASQSGSAPLLATAPTLAPGSTHVAILRPGERGTPTPASMLPSYTMRGPARTPVAPRSTVVPVTTERAFALPSGSGAGTAELPPASRTQVRPAPTLAPLPGVAVRGNPSTAVVSPIVVVPVPQPATQPNPYSPVQLAPPVPRRSPPPSLPAPAASMPQASNPVVLGPAGIPLPPAPAPVVRAAPVPSVGQAVVPAGAVVVVPVQAAPVERPPVRPTADGDAAKGAKSADRNPAAVLPTPRP